MIITPVEDVHFTELGKSIPYDESQPFIFKEPVSIHDIGFIVSWQSNQVIGTFFLRVDYYNAAGDVIMINYSAYNYPENKLTLFPKHDKQAFRDFICTSVKFQYGGFAETGKIAFLIVPFKFESEQERKDKVKEAKDNNNEGFATYTDSL